MPYQEGNNPSQSAAYSIPILIGCINPPRTLTLRARSSLTTDSYSVYVMSLPRPLTRQEQDSQKGKSDLRFSDIASYIRERLLLEELVSHKLSKEGNEDGILCHLHSLPCSSSRLCPRSFSYSLRKGRFFLLILSSTGFASISHRP